MKQTGFFLLFLTVLSSCVGTVQDAKLKLNDLFDEDKETLNFNGIEEARAISHNKVELEFYPAAISDPNFKYQLYINNSLNPIEINPEALDKAASGRVRYLVDNLNINTKYKFKIRLKNNATGALSKNEKEKEVTTFDNKTADFKGVISLSKVNGQSDSSIRVDWVSAKMEGSTTTGPYDPLYYEITVIGEGGIQNLNNPSYTAPDKRKIRVPPSPTNLSPFNYTSWTSQIIGSLEPDTEYYVQVRAINRLYDQFLQDTGISIIPVDKEINTKFLSIKTDPATGVFDFNVESFRTQPAGGALAKTRVISSWVPASGSYVGYRLFYIPCTGSSCNNEAEVSGTDLLTDSAMDDILSGSSSNGAVINTNVLTSSITSYSVNGLDPYTWYQMKLVACRTVSCSRSSGDAIVSSLRVVRTAPILAPFTGITRVGHPDSSESQNQISLEFDVPDLATGYADTMEFFCIDPDSITAAQNSLNFVKIPYGSAVTGSSISRCNGLSLCGPNASDCASDSLNYSVASSTSIRIKGTETNGTRYCFAAFPAIREESEELPASHPTQDWIIRCLNPEVKTPTIAEFPGINGSCSIVNNSISVNWSKPTSGIYNGYRVLWRKIDSNENFSFAEAASDVQDSEVNTPASPYFASSVIDPDTLSYTIPNLRPGTRYKVGVLTQTTGGSIKWSEYNTNIKDCVTAMPKFKFEEWTRIFAMGPKTDGRYALKRDYIGTTAVRSFSNDAYIFEALNPDGIPYELAINPSDNVVDLDGTYFKPPGSYGGSYSPGGFGDDFDGAPGSFGDGSGTLVAASNQGIVSLAWKDVTLDFLGDEFKDCQVNAGETTPNTYCYRNSSGVLTLPSQKKQRRYGYKVYRSSDNRLTWQDITKLSTESDTDSGSSLVYAKDYVYYKRPDLPAVTERMVFFTDYSVQAMKTDPTANSRGRIYWYKVVPYFDNKPLSLDSSQMGAVGAPHEIKVILPPANMALVHRWMANRQACNELGRDGSIDKVAHYTCAFNGFGAKAKGFPWNPSNTVVDLGGHLLVDRFELGCNFTRGDVNANPVENGQSFFTRAGPYSGWQSHLAEFRGYATDTAGNDLTTRRFMGCTRRQPGGSTTDTLAGYSSNPSTDGSTNYRLLTHGDCIGYGMILMNDSVCSDPERTQYRTYTFPGAFYEGTGASTDSPKLDCTASTATKPTVANELLSLTFRKNILLQSEFAAVYYHTMPPHSAVGVNPEGPSGNTLDWDATETSWGKKASCYINLAAIGSAGSGGNWIARWYGAGDLEVVKDSTAPGGKTDLAQKTIGEISSNGNLYNATNFRMPDAGMRNDARFSDNTKIGRIISSNSSKLPPITGLSPTAAQSLCSTYEVEIGFSSNGTNFLSLALPQPKRLLGRQELISASAWPEGGDNGVTGNFNYRETSSSARISLLEAGAIGGACVDSGTSIGMEVLFHGAALNARIPKRSFATPLPPESNISGPLFTGSSQNDGSVHSRLCVSKYGLQDLIGNAAEITTDRLFCDYGADRLFFGKYETGQGYELESAQMPNYDSEDEEIVWMGAKVIQETGTGDVELINGTSTQGRMWADISPNSGYCSIADDEDPGVGYGALVSRYRDNNDNFINVLKPDQTLNTDMVKRSNPIVQTNIDKLRNGDGYFLNFGTNTPGPYLQRTNAMALSRDGITYDAGMALGPYFNPVIGMTMRCPGSTCDQSEDNMIASTAYFMDHPDSAKPAVEPGIARFPAGNSQLMNKGISETTYMNGATNFSVDFGDPLQRQSISHYRVVTGIRIKLDGSVEYTRAPVFDWAEAEFGTVSNAGVQNFSQVSFDLPRGAPLHLVHGGGARTSKAGRYTLQTLNGERVRSQRDAEYTTARCGVLIEE